MYLENTSGLTTLSTQRTNMAYRALHFCLDTNGNLSWVTETTAPSATTFAVSKTNVQRTGDVLTEFIPGYTQGNGLITSALELISSDPVTGTFNLTNATGSSIVASSVTSTYSVVNETGSAVANSLAMVTATPSVTITDASTPVQSPPAFAQDQVITL